MTSRRHISIVLPSLRGGGAERVNLTLAAALAARGHRVDLVAFEAEGELLRLVSPEVRVVGLGKRRISRALPRLARYFRRERPDVAIAVLDSVAAVALLAARLAGGTVAVIAQSHSSPATTESRARGPLLWLLRRLYPGAPAVVAVSEGLAGELSRLTGRSRDSITVIHNGVVDETLAQRAASASQELPEGEALLAAAGRLHPVKDYPTMIAAMALLRDRGVRFRLRIAGEGPERPRLEAAIRDAGLSQRVELLGFVDDPLPLIGGADVLLLSSRTEGLPTVLLEALACGTNVVATDCPFGPREILGGGRYGRLVPVGDAGAMAEAIEATLASPVADDVLRGRARDFTVERMASDYEALVESTLS